MRYSVRGPKPTFSASEAAAAIRLVGCLVREAGAPLAGRPLDRLSDFFAALAIFEPSLRDRIAGLIWLVAFPRKSVSPESKIKIARRHVVRLRKLWNSAFRSVKASSTPTDLPCT